MRMGFSRRFSWRCTSFHNRTALSYRREKNSKMKWQNYQHRRLPSSGRVWKTNLDFWFFSCLFEKSRFLCSLESTQTSWIIPWINPQVTEKDSCLQKHFKLIKMEIGTTLRLRLRCHPWNGSEKLAGDARWRIRFRSKHRWLRRWEDAEVIV